MTKSGSTRGAGIWRFFKLFSDLASPANLTILAGLALILVTGVFGGWNAADAQPETTPRASSSEAVSARPFTISISDSFWTSDPSPLPGGFQEAAFFVVKARVVNTTESWIQAPLLSQAITATIPNTDLQPQSGLWSNALVSDGSMGGPTAYRVIDLQSARAFQPALEQEYWLVWELPPDTPRSPQVQLQYFSHTWRASSLDGGFFWTDRSLVAVQSLSAAVEGEVI
ncbi:hypothetical protein [Schaalia sp. JY-X159]|uniref:hypothetical protein n=1 Tax=Schaalia sp. JY-X159 TaxID=2758575 RepID=UPI00165EA2A9|nr:hypothetical protein [Schaalia sp. JY-X159]